MKMNINKIFTDLETNLQIEKEKFGDISLSDISLEAFIEFTKFKYVKRTPKIQQVNQIAPNVSENQNLTQNLTNQNLNTNTTFISINPNSVNKDWEISPNLEVLDTNINKCLSCELGATRKNFVFGSGNPKAKIMIIGEAPGADEDEEGLPFIGRAGQLLTKILESINLSREEVYIANIIKCRPPNNRRPTTAEVDNCEPYLLKQIELINPEFILALGLTAVDTLLKDKHKMQDVRGNILNYHNRKLLVTYHPAALLRNPNWKRFVWEDVKNLRKMYDNYLSEIS
jgi:DNA polymerase